MDSGGQYRDGTTDITRTVAVGTPTAEMKDCFTRVLKGHIALANASFPRGTRGVQLDAIARHHLWVAGLDYQHGTGHGVGSCLCVHEGPHGISNVNYRQDSLLPNMIVSNEPGYYKAGEFGIRIENLMLVIERGIGSANRTMLCFETLSFAPIDRCLINVDLLDRGEVVWVNDYHQQVWQRLHHHLDAESKRWLFEATQPITDTINNDSDTTNDEKQRVSSCLG
jgi:Xaa-Pro aminopeptidase